MKMREYGREIKIGIIGLGARGYTQLKLLATMPDIRIQAICDLIQDRVDRADVYLKGINRADVHGYTDVSTMFERENIEAVIIMTSWETHIPLAVQAMKKGIIPGMEVGGASSIQECWELVKTSENTRIPCMMLENCCYGQIEMTLLNMVKRGLFGALVHCEGGYEHDLREEIGKGDIDYHYRQRHFLHRNGELYPSHELGPISSYLNLNRGNRMVSLVSVSSKGVGLSEWLKENRKDKPALQNSRVTQGDIVNTIISCSNGETILLTHDCTLPRPYSRGGRIQGTKGIWMEDNRSIYIDGRSPVDPNYWTHRWESDESYMHEYEHPLWQDYRKSGIQGGHDGMDFLVLRAFIEAIQQKTPFPIDVYDAASWISVTPLSESSIVKGGITVEVPDFTNGLWLNQREGAHGNYVLI